MEPALFRQIWPIFSAEAREHLGVIGSGLLALEADPARVALLDPVRRTAHSLKGSAASLGLTDVEQLAHAVEGSLAAYDPAAGLSRDQVQAALDALEAIEEALVAADGGGDAGIPTRDALLAALGAPAAPRRRSSDPLPAAAPPEAPAEPHPGALPAPAQLDVLESCLEALCAPLDASERRRLVAGVAEAARALLAVVPPHARDLAERLQALAPRLDGDAAGAARAVAAVAGDLVELRERLARAPAGAAAPEAARAPDKAIRVLTSTLDSLARQLELLALSEARHGRRAREVAGAEAEAREVVRGLEQALAALRAGGQAAALAGLEGAVHRLRALGGELGRLSRDGQREAESQRLTGAVLREDLRALRLVPAALVLEPLRRAAREVAGRLGKAVELELLGGDVKLDRRVVDELREPLLHLVRNAVDHGVEPAGRRRAAGKPEAGRLAVRVEPRGAHVAVLVQDDGPGLDLAALRARAVEAGRLSAAEAAALPDGEAARLVFTPGLSTARAVTEVSGRGVGLDVVAEAVGRLGGTVEVAFEPGRSTRFTLEVPLTLAATAGLLIRTGRAAAALAADVVERVLLLRPGDVTAANGRSTVRVGEAVLPFAWLCELLGGDAGVLSPRGQPALLLALGGQRAVVAVEEVAGQQELVVSSLGARAARVAHLAGAAVLDDGRVVGVLNPAELLRRLQPAAPRPVLPPRRVVVADDALTTRAAMKAILELAGYQVTAVADGEEAWQVVRQQGAALVVSDVQMPRLDGLGLARRLKADPRLAGVPVILVTSLDAPEDRAAGLAAGADGYLVKREVEQGRLLDLVRRLLPGAA